MANEKNQGYDPEEKIQSGTKLQPATRIGTSLEHYQNVNVIGGKGQQEPVRIVLEGNNETITSTLEQSDNVSNFWSMLKKRPLSFMFIKTIYRLSLLDSTQLSEFTRIIDETGTVMARQLRHNIYTLFSHKKTSSANTESSSVHDRELLDLLVKSTGSISGARKQDYTWLKNLTGVFLNLNFSYNEHSIDKLETALGESQLNYIKKMMHALNVTETVMPINTIELIWSYWMEEGMLVQTMNAISRRFQNMRNGERDPLVNLTIDPLRGASNLLWGYIQDAPNRLTVQRRSYEYDNHYGLRLYGNAVPQLSSADSRSKFIGAFNNLLLKCGSYYKQADNKMIVADGFPLLNALQELHLILAEGANNQFGNLPLEARIEMMVEQQILAREEIREFLNNRPMLPYKEEWMGRVDAMKKLQQWDSTGVTHFYDLANFGEMLLLSIRLINWSDVNSSELAGNWALYFRNEIQKYIFSYRAVTGVDLSSEHASSPQQRQTIPGILIQQRMRRS